MNHLSLTSRICSLPSDPTRYCIALVTSIVAHQEELGATEFMFSEGKQKQVLRSLWSPVGSIIYTP
jgi:hypothetical protein